MRTAIALLVFNCFLMTGCSSDLEPVEGCVGNGPVEPICQFRKPEDLELLPDGKTLVVSQMGDIDGHEPGSLVLYDTADGIIQRLPLFTEDTDKNWGGQSCPGAPGAQFSPHGIHLSRNAVGENRLLVVNHGGRESVEFFEVIRDGGHWRLNWRGCVVAPPGSLLNDVVALPGAGFLVTHMFPKSNPRWGNIGTEIIKASLGIDTGSVLHWDGLNFREMKGSKAPVPNGIQINESGDEVYLNVYMGSEVRKLSFPDGELLGSAEIKSPDNIQWAGERLLVASHVASVGDMLACSKVNSETSACAAAFEIVELNPDTMQLTRLFAHSGAPMGAATVAQRVGDALYLGSYVGNRIARVTLPPDQSAPGLRQ